MAEAQASVELQSDTAELARLAAVVADFAATHALPREAASDLNLALEEVVTNVIVHGYGQRGGHTVRVRLIARPSEVIAEVEDDAPAYDPLARPAPNLETPLEERTIGGLGIHLVRSLMDAVTYHRHGNCNRLTLTKRWPAPA